MAKTPTKTPAEEDTSRAQSSGAGNPAGAVIPEAADIALSSTEEEFRTPTKTPGEEDTSRATQTGGAGDPAGPAVEGGGVALPSTEAELRAKYPRLSAASDAWRAAGKGEPPRSLRISSRKEGFRRGGMAHGRETREHAMDTLQPEQIEAILGEPNLIVELV